MRVRHLVLPVLTLGLLLAGCAEEANAPSRTGPAVSFVIVSGSGQSGPVDSELPLPLKVQATDASNQPVPGVVVNFVVTAGGGSVFAGSALTDANGIAADIWRLGTVAGSAQTLEVRAVDAAGAKHTYGSFTATAVAGLPASITLEGGDGQSATVGTAVPVAPAVKLLDAFGNRVPSFPVTFAISAGGGTVNGGAAVTDPQGIAHPTSWVLGPAAGPNGLTATAGSLSPVGFTATGLPAVVLHLGLVTPPSSSAQNGAPLGTQPTVQLLDPQNQPIAQAGVPITVGLNGSGAALSGGALVNTNSSGIATFSGLTITGTVGSYSLTFQGPGMSPLNSGNITLGAGPAATMALSAGDGQTGNTGTPVAIAPAVLITDQSGNPVQGVSVTFAVTAGGGSVTGSPAISGSDGIARVGSWILGATGGANGLSATLAGVSGSPVSFSATAVVPAGNFWTTINAPMTTPRRFTGFGVVNGVMWVSGGNVIGPGFANQGYSAATNAWLWKRDLPARRSAPASAVLNGEIYVVGGTNEFGAYQTTTYSYNPSTNNWTTRAPIPEAKDFPASAVVNGILYVAGGGSPTGLSSTVYAYDPATNSWTQKASMPMARGDLVGVSLGGLFYVVGGSTMSGPDGALLAYDPATNTWTSKATMPTARLHMNAEALNGKLYAIGGLLGTTGTSVTTVDIYDPVTNAWTAGAPISVARNGAATGVINGKIYLSGGDTGSGNTGVTEFYTP